MNRNALHAARAAAASTIVLAATGRGVVTLVAVCAMAAFLLPRAA